MLAEIGLISLIFSFFASLYAIPVAIYGGYSHSERLVQSARNASLATFPLLLVSCTLLLIALMTGEFQINYVRNTTDPLTPNFYRITALWGSQEGSLLFWSLLMSLFSTLTLTINWQRERRLMPGVIAFLMATLAFFLFLIIVYENPFERAWVVQDGTKIVVKDSLFIPKNAASPSTEKLADDATGLNPLLRHFGMIIHPPMLYLGFVGFMVPFAFAMAALSSGDLSTNWIKATRRWTLIAWLFLSLGLILGGRWAYDVLGWGGYWGWDPVENAAFLPWLIATAFLHSVMIQEKRGMLKIWNMFLIIGTFSAVLFGTLATRSGLVESVHSFARSGIGTPMFIFWGGMTFIGFGLIVWRWNQGMLKDERHLTGWLSRETMFLLNNIVFIGLFAAIFWGSFGAPITSELFIGSIVNVRTDYFMRVTPPLFAVMYILMGVAPLTAWGATSIRRITGWTARTMMIIILLLTILIFFLTRNVTALIAYSVIIFAGVVALFEIIQGTRARMRARGENPIVAFIALFTRNRRRYGGYIVHLGIVIIGIGVISSTLFQIERQETLTRGEIMQVNTHYAMRFDTFTRAIAEDGRIMDVADVTVIRNGSEVAQIRPRIDRFEQLPMTIAGAHSTLENDFYVLFAPGEAVNFDKVTFKVYINPLINFVWWGGLILILGTVTSAWPNETIPATLRSRTTFGQKIMERATV